uniref:Ycf15 n=2 Tax=Tinospora TaxID=41789 RepID=A0A6M3WDA2_9MAGN|nr:Ycf15 [Tinospora cordifolia]QCC70904.1 Ycf15 [Tinospora cordifolia]QJF59522.1 Ycf15 [Tinospora sinensis]QJF59534.1 Ycf15 [Tinospora sinensis]
MRVQLHCIARIRVVYLKRVDLFASLMVQSSSRGKTPLSPRSTEKKCRTDANSSSRKKGLTEPGSLTNTNIIEKNCLFCILSPVPLLPRALRNRSDHIDIPSTQHRSSKGSRTTHQSTKARIFQKMDSYSKSA